MKLIKRLNPFALGGWRGPGTKNLFHYAWSDRPSQVSEIWLPATEVKQFFAANGLNYDDFKKFYKGMAGAPRKVARGVGPQPRWCWLYAAEHVWDYAFQKGFADYPGPRLSVDNKLTDEDGNPWRERQPNE